MTAVVVYKAVDNAAVSAHWEASEKAHNEWWERVKAFGASIGHTKLSIRNGMFGSHVVGYVPEEGETPDEGWRIHKDWDVCVPNLRSKAGKALDTELQGLSWRPPSSIGVKDHLHAPSDAGGFSTYMLAPAIKLGNAGDWFLSFSRKPFDDELHKIDETVWAPAKLSDFYAQTEEAA
jgi:hypothetical protein